MHDCEMKDDLLIALNSMLPLLRACLYVCLIFKAQVNPFRSNQSPCSPKFPFVKSVLESKTTFQKANIKNALFIGYLAASLSTLSRGTVLFTRC